MFTHPARPILVVIASLVLLAASSAADEIGMLDGTVYADVMITRRDAVSLEYYPASGNKRTLRLLDVAEINGVRVAPLSARPLGSPARPRTSTPPGATPPSATAPAPARSPVARPTPAVVDATPPHEAAPTPVRPSPAEGADQTQMGTPDPAFAAPGAAANTSTGHARWVLPALAGLAALWLGSLWRVRRRLPRGRDGTSRLWLIAAVAVPFGGYVWYELAPSVRRLLQGPPPPPVPPPQFEFLDADQRPILIKPGLDSSGLQDAKGVLQDALLDRASDVHIEPGATECRVRFRIDGVLHPRMRFSAEEGLRVISALKSVAELDITDRRKAQDGRFGGRVGVRQVDFRAATTPSLYGEKLVLRILDQQSGLRGLDNLGMNPRMMERFADVIQSRSGMILASGPTGSGKTSTLYAAITQLDLVRLNIVTIEDPVEYELPGATQIPVNVKTGITYESGLRSILRQDPDVILVGEMRDLEAGQIALRSALTGHLMFTSLHARDAISTIHRLEEMGIERHLLASALFVVMAQRLVRVLCPHCREPYAAQGNELAELGIGLPAGETIYRATGCRRCESSGYVGRTGIFEMLILEEDLRQAINSGVAQDQLTELARAKGYRSYREDGAEKILVGVTTVDEVLKAT